MISGIISDLEDIQTSKFIQRKNIKTININTKSLFRIVIKSGNKKIEAMDLTLTMTWKALGGSITINNAKNYDNIYFLNQNEFTFTNGSKSDLELKAYVATTLGELNVDFTANPALSAPLIPQPTLVNENLITTTNSRSKRLNIESTASHIQQFNSTDMTNAYIPDRSAENAPNSFKQHYPLKPARISTRSMNTVIDDIRAALIDNKVDNVSIITQERLIESEGEDKSNDAKINTNVILSSESNWSQSIEFIDHKIIPQEPRIELVDEINPKTPTKIELSSDVVFIENSIYNTSFQHAK